MSQRTDRRRAERGSVLLIAIFTLVLLTGLGVSLLLLTGDEIQMSRTDVTSKQAFFLAEAGLEHARMTLFAANGKGTFDGELAAAYGSDGFPGFDPTTLMPVYDGGGMLTGFTGTGDDSIYTSVTPLGTNGWYAAFVTNDPTELSSVGDTNDRIMLNGVGVGPRGSVEVVQAIVVRESLVGIPPASITILGPAPDFWGGDSTSKRYQGDDCSDPSVSVPTVGVVGPAAEALADAGVSKPETYTSGGAEGADTVQDVTSMLDPEWSDCAYWLELAANVRSRADVVGGASTPLSQLGTPGNEKVVFIDGDYLLLGGPDVHAGILWVSGHLTLAGNTSWQGTIFAVGRGSVSREDGGNGTTMGAVVVADVAGPDETLFTADDCTGPDGLPGTSDDGMMPGRYSNTGGGNHTTGYCLSAIDDSIPAIPYRIASFRQR